MGPMYDSATKPQTLIAGPETVHAARGITSLPLVAIGGITLENAAKVLAAGCRMLAICSAIIGSSDVASSAGRFRELVERTALCGEAVDSDRH